MPITVFGARQGETVAFRFSDEADAAIRAACQLIERVALLGLSCYLGLDATLPVAGVRLSQIFLPHSTGRHVAIAWRRHYAFLS